MSMLHVLNLEISIIKKFFRGNLLMDTSEC